MGLSHLLQPKMWEDFFNYLHDKGTTGNMINAMIALGMGTLILAFHPVWKGPLILVTLYGLSQFLKGGMFLVVPELGLKSIARVRGKSNKFKWVGLFMFLMGLLLAIYLANSFLQFL
jgi:hypothetical protein